MISAGGVCTQRRQWFRIRHQRLRPASAPTVFAGALAAAGFGLPRIVDWQNDAKNYEFWVHADRDGNFTIPNVRPGTYSLHAIADGVLGDLTVSNVVVNLRPKAGAG